MNTFKWLGISLLAGALLFAAGCTSTPPSAEPDPEPAASGEPIEPGTPSSEETPTAETDPDAGSAAGGSGAGDPVDAKNAISVASPQNEPLIEEFPEDLYMNEDDREAMTSAEKARQEQNRRNYDVTGRFDPAVPTLMGVAIGDAAASIGQRFGEPTSTSVLPDDAVEASVLNFPGFTIGVRNQKVLFVEVSTRSINPGLNGLRLGDELASATEKLGQPTTSSEFVVTYAGNGSILKLDVDPDTKQIHSMKLFPEE